MTEDTFKIWNCVIQMSYRSQVNGMTKEARQAFVYKWRWWRGVSSCLIMGRTFMADNASISGLNR